jgi:S1-C subfamily serine protease
MVTPEGPARGKKLLVAMVVLLLVVGSVAIYYESMDSQRNKSDSSTISSLSSEVQSLQEANNALSQQLASLSSSSGSSGSLTPVQIYSEDHLSVVTVQGANETTVETWLGPETSIITVLGSGFVMEYGGSPYVITNYHVVDPNYHVENLTVTFSDGDAYPASVIGTDPYADLAVLKVPSAPASEFVPIQVVSSLNVTVGQQVYAIGNPYGLSGSMTLGIVSQLGRTIQDPVSGNFSVAGVIQFSAAINPGNSGGPLLNSKGQVIGITTATVSSSQGIGFAIPSSTILREISSLVTTGGYTMYSYLGISMVDNSLQLAEASGTTVTYGVLLEGVVAGSPAANALLRAGTKAVYIEGSQYYVGGDIIVSANGTKIIDEDALSTYLVQNTVAGQKVVFGVIRSGALINVTVTLGTRPAT